MLLPGRGGSGKSSTSLACLLAGLDFLGDDYLAVALDPEPRIYCLYSTAKLERVNLTRYPELRRCRTAYEPGFEKVVLFLEEGFGEQLRSSLPLDLVLKPRISGSSDTTLGPAEAIEIERALNAETLAHLPHVGVSTLEFLERVSRNFPRAVIHLGTERARIPAAIRAALKTPPAVTRSNGHAAPKRPFVSAVVHFWEEDREELRALAAEMEAQGYSRTELLVILDGPACVMADEIATLPENVRFFCSQDPVVNAEAWNRGIREAFADLLVFLEPGDRLQPGALEALLNGCEREPKAAWVQGKAIKPGAGEFTPHSAPWCVGSEKRISGVWTVSYRTPVPGPGALPMDRASEGKRPIRDRNRHRYASNSRARPDENRHASYQA